MACILWQHNSTAQKQPNSLYATVQHTRVAYLPEQTLLGDWLKLLYMA